MSCRSIVSLPVKPARTMDQTGSQIGLIHALINLPDLTEEQLAADPRAGLLRLVFGFLLQQDCYCAAAMLVAERIHQIRRIEQAESSGNLSVPSVKSASVIWRHEVRGFKYRFGASDDTTVARLMPEFTDKVMEAFVAGLAVELQVSHSTRPE